MKLKRHHVTYNGGFLPEDEFAFVQGSTDTSPIRIVFHCRGCLVRPRICAVDITLGPAIGYKHGWDGNLDEPTLTPSVVCDKPLRCGWHGLVIRGDWT